MEEVKNELREAFKVLDTVMLPASQAEKIAIVKSRMSRAFLMLEKGIEEQKQSGECLKEENHGESA